MGVDLESKSDRPIETNDPALCQQFCRYEYNHSCALTARPVGQAQDYKRNHGNR
jgi:hypothetical protein